MLTITADSPVPPFEQVRAQLAQQILDNKLVVGTRLPTVRRLAADLGLAANTVARAYREMAARLGPAMTGALVQPMAADGVEIIIGGVEHPAFGPLIMVGMGGPTAELLTDRAFRVPPVTRQDAAEMLRELRCYPLLTGYRGRPEANIAALEEQIVRVARFLGDVPEAAELDLNPVLVTPRGAVAVDVRLRLAPLPPPPSPYRRRLR